MSNRSIDERLREKGYKFADPWSNQARQCATGKNGEVITFGMVIDDLLNQNEQLTGLCRKAFGVLAMHDGCSRWGAASMSVCNDIEKALAKLEVRP